MTVLSLLLAATLIACAAPPASSGPGGSQAPDREYTVAIALSAQLASIETNVNAFKETLDKSGLKIRYVEKNAQGQLGNAPLMAKQVVQDKPDLIFVIGTPIVISLAQETKDIPILFGIMTDPVAAKVVESPERPGGNLTGTSNYLDVAVFFDLIKEVLPNARRVGMMGNVAEDNTKITIDRARAEATKRGMEFIVAPIASTNDLVPAVKSLQGRVDILYTPGDNTLQAAMPTVVQLTLAEKIPLITSGTFGDVGATFGVGANYVEM